MWDSHGNLDVTGRLASDRPHAVKLYGSYTLPSRLGDTEIGGFFSVASGTPQSTLVQDVRTFRSSSTAAATLAAPRF
jgi:hypothetical protein